MLVGTQLQLPFVGLNMDPVNLASKQGATLQHSWHFVWLFGWFHKGSCYVVASKATTSTAMQLFIVTMVVWNVLLPRVGHPLWAKLHQANGARSHHIGDQIRLYLAVVLYLESG